MICNYSNTFGICHWKRKLEQKKENYHVSLLFIREIASSVKSTKL
jgi:hypothetical protein